MNSIKMGKFILVVILCTGISASENSKWMEGPTFGIWKVRWQRDTFDNTDSNWEAYELYSENNGNIAALSFECPQPSKESKQIHALAGDEWLPSEECQLTLFSMTMESLIASSIKEDLVLALSRTPTNPNTRMTKFKIDDNPVIENHGFYPPTIATKESLHYLLERMRKGKHIKIRTDWKGHVHTFSFTLVGFANAMDWVLQKYGYAWDEKMKEIHPEKPERKNQ